MSIKDAYGPPAIFDDYDIVVVRLGGKRFVPLRVEGRKGLDFIYDPLQQGALSAPLTGGAVQMASVVSPPAASYQDNMPFQITNTKGITNFLEINHNDELLQVHMGVAPSYIRVGIKQPSNTPTAEMDWNMSLLGGSTLMQDIHNFDGFDSPFRAPTRRSEFLIMRGIQPTFTLLNPVTASPDSGGWVPRLNMLINRCYVCPLHDYDLIRSLFTHAPAEDLAHFRTIGRLFSEEVAFDSSSYGKVEPINPKIFQDADWKSKLHDAGY